MRSEIQAGKHNIAGKNRTQKTEENLCTVSVTRRCWFDKTFKPEPHLTKDGLQCRKKTTTKRKPPKRHTTYCYVRFRLLSPVSREQSDEKAVKPS